MCDDEGLHEAPGEPEQEAVGSGVSTDAAIRELGSINQ